MRNAISGMWESLQEALGPHFDNRTFQALSLLGKYFGATNPPNVAYNAVGSEIVERKKEDQFVPVARAGFKTVFRPYRINELDQSEGGFEMASRHVTSVTGGIQEDFSRISGSPAGLVPTRSLTKSTR